MLTSAWHLSSLRRDAKATIRVPLAAVRENSAVQSPNPQEFGRMTWMLARAYVVCLRFAQAVKRSKQAAAGLAVAIYTVVAHSYFTRKVERLAVRMETIMSQTLTTL